MIVSEAGRFFWAKNTMGDKRRRRWDASMARMASSLLALLFLGAGPAQARVRSSALSQVRPMGVLEAMRQAPGIELRDANNRVISREALGRETREGFRRMTGQAAGLSQTPGLSTLLDYLDRRGQLTSRWQEGVPRSGHRAAAVAAQPMRSPKLMPPPILASLVPAEQTGKLNLTPLELTYTPGRIRVLVLRE